MKKFSIKQKSKKALTIRKKFKYLLSLIFTVDLQI